MSRVITALVVGAVIGAAIFLSFRRESPSLAPETTSTAAGPGATAALATSRAFVSATRPGLVVTVTRGGAAEAQAQVELTRSSRSIASGDITWQPAGSERSDHSGRTEFPALAGRYLVTATASDGTRAVQTIDVSWGGAPTFVTIALKAAVLFSGQVVDRASRRPLAQATIRADPQADAQGEDPTIAIGKTITDSLGRFGLQLPEQRWRFEARAPGYLSNAMTADEAKKDLTIELTKGVEISGVVVGAAGQPIADAALRLTPGDVRNLTSDREGRFAFIAPHEPVSVHALAPDGRQGLSRLALTAKDERAQVRIVVGEGSGLTGLVRDEKGPVAQAEVRVLAEPDSLEVASFETAADGHFAAKALPPGRYSVLAQQGLGRRATVVGLEVPGAGPVELVLTGAGRLIGVVHDADAQPVEGASVTLGWPSGLNEVKRTARTGPDGRFEFDDLLPAEVRVQAQLDDLFSEETGTYVAPGATVEVVLVTAAQGRLVITLTGAPMDKVMVRNERPGGEFIEADKIDGHFEKLIPPGTYRLFAETRGEKKDEFKFIESITATVRAGEVTTVVLDVPDEFADAGTRVHRSFMMHPELGSGVSFENSPGGVRVDFLMADCPAAKAGVQLGDLVVAIDGETTRNALDAFARVRKPSGEALDLLIRRDGQDLKLTVR